MHFEPHNRHLWILPLNEKKEDKEAPLFVMPEEYRTTVQEIKAGSETIYVVKENYVYGRLEE